MRVLKQQNGSFLASAVVVTSMFLFIALGMATYVFNRYHLAQRSVASSSALLAAQSGLDIVVEQVNRDEYYYKYCSCLGQESTLAAGGTHDKTTYTVMNVAATTGSDRQSYEMTVTVMGKVYQGNSSTLISQKAIKATLSALNSDGTKNADFDYVLRIGPANAEITVDALIRGPQAIIDGYIVARGTSTDESKIYVDKLWAYGWQCGSSNSAFPKRCGASDPANTDAAVTEGCQGSPQKCPEFSVRELHVPGATGFHSGRFLAPLTVYGDALTPPPYPELPRAEIKSAVTNTLTGDISTCSTLGTKPGETTKIVGNVLINTNCNMYIQGDLWVTGYFLMQGNSELHTSATDVDGKIIRNAPIVMVDGTHATGGSVRFYGNGTNYTKNTYGTGLIIGSYYCAAASCPEGPLTQSEFQTASDLVTVAVNPDTGNSLVLDGLALYTRWGHVSYLRTSNMNGAIVAQGITTGAQNVAITMDDPSELNLGGRQGKVYKIKSYNEFGLPNTNSAVALSEGETAGDIAIGSDGLPIMTYYKQSGVQLKVLKCGNATCSSGNTTSIIGAGGDYSSIAIGSDGYPRIAYTEDGSGKRLIKFAQCVNHSCSSGTVLSTIHDVASTSFSDVEIAIGSEGLPVIAYFNETAGDARVAKCGNEACSTGNTLTAVATAGDIGQGPSITIGLNGFPVLSYKTPTNSGVQILRCGNAACSSGNSPLEIAMIPSVTGWNSSIAIGADLFPIISHWNETNGSLRITKCTAITCSSNTSTTVDGDGSCAGTATNCTSGDVGSWSSVQIGSSGLPVIAYRDSSAGDLRVIKCGNAACSSGNTITIVESTGTLGREPSMALSNEGYPVIIHYDTTNAVPRVVKCASFSCQ